MQSGNQLDTTTRRMEARFAETVLCLQVKIKVGYKTEIERGTSHSVLMEGVLGGDRC